MLSNKKLIEFFEGPGKQKSSKRLIGILSGIALIYLAVRGGEHLLSINNSEAFLRLFDSLCFFVAGVLGLGLADHKLKSNDQEK